jgi:hypothetical protein
MENDPWQQEVDPQNLPGVTRAQIHDFVHALASDENAYRWYKNAEQQGNVDEILARLAREHGITVPRELVEGARLPDREDLQQFLADYDSDPPAWGEMAGPSYWFNWFWPFGISRWRHHVPRE